MQSGLRGQGTQLPSEAGKIGVPPRPFLYTVDQLGVMLELSTKRIMSGYLYFEGRSVGVRRKDLMVARNIAPANEKPEWRVAEREFVRWMKVKGFRFYDRSVVSN